MYELLKVEARETSQLRPNQLRRTGFVPAVLYGKGMDSVPLKIEQGALKKALSRAGHVLEIDLKNKKYLVNMEEIQRDPLSQRVTHVAFHNLDRNQETTVTLPIVLVGEAPGVKEGGIVLNPFKEVEVTGLPADITESIHVDVSGLALHGQIHLSDVKAPKGLKFDPKDLEQIVATCSPPKAEKVEEAPAAAAPAEGEAAAAEGAGDAAAGDKKKEE